MSSNSQADTEATSLATPTQEAIADALKEQHAKTVEKFARQRGKTEAVVDVTYPEGYLLKLTYEATSKFSQLNNNIKIESLPCC